MFYILGTEDCEFCRMATDFLSEKSQAYVFYELTNEEEINDLKRHWAHPTIPIVLFITPYGVEYIGGFDDLSKEYNTLQRTYGLPSGSFGI
jgi:glutaredoxin